MLDGPCAEQEHGKAAEDDIQRAPDRWGRDPGDMIVGSGTIGLKSLERNCYMGKYEKEI